MTISELIEDLQEKLKKYGDIEVAITKTLDYTYIYEDTLNSRKFLTIKQDL